MKKLIITFSMVFSGFVFGQENSDNPYVYEDASSSSAEDTFPGNPGDPNAAPIDEYVPVLLILAVGMIVVYKKKRSISE